ncbi:MAG: S-layer homology domain-containing protein [Hominilimicola sp.]
MLTDAPESISAPSVTEKPTASTMPSNINVFLDIHEDTWYYNSVKYVLENGLMSEIDETEFAPDMNITRGMFVTVLYRTENEPETVDIYAFADVAADVYYADAVYRYAKFKVYDTNVDGSISYSDSMDISDYAKDAVIWSMDNGIMFGNEDNTVAMTATAVVSVMTTVTVAEDK